MKWETQIKICCADIVKYSVTLFLCTMLTHNNTLVYGAFSAQELEQINTYHVKIKELTKQVRDLYNHISKENVSRHYTTIFSNFEKIIETSSACVELYNALLEKPDQYFKEPIKFYVPLRLRYENNIKKMLNMLDNLTNVINPIKDFVLKKTF